MATKARVQIFEAQQHRMRGNFPKIETYTGIDTSLLYENDPNPFHLTLPIAEVGRVSANSLLYDEYLVQEIENQLANGGLDGIAGHIPEDQASSAFPLPVIYWIGTKREKEVLWAKGYIPPGDLREYVRLKMAQGGTVGTSIYGYSDEVNTNKQGVYTLKGFKLHSLDVVQSRAAALPLGLEQGFAVTAEMAGDVVMEGEMSKPEAVAETAALVAEAQQRVSELESQLTETQQQLTAAQQTLEATQNEVAELRQYAAIVMEIRGRIGDGADVTTIFGQYHEMATQLAAQLGVPYTDISLKVEEYHNEVAELRRKHLDRAIDDAIAEATAWQVTSENGKRHLAALRTTVRSMVVGQVSESAQAGNVVKAVMESDTVKALAEAVLAKIAGPGAFVGGNGRTEAKPLNSPEAMKEIKQKFGLTQ